MLQFCRGESDLYPLRQYVADLADTSLRDISLSTRFTFFDVPLEYGADTIAAIVRASRNVTQSRGLELMVSEASDQSPPMTPLSRESIEAVHALVRSLDRDTTSRIRTSFVYGSVPRGEANRAPHYSERRVYRGVTHDHSVFTRLDQSYFHGDVDVGVISDNPDHIRDPLFEALTSIALQYPTIHFSILLFPTDVVVGNIHTNERADFFRIITLFHRKIFLLGQESFRIYSDAALARYHHLPELLDADLGYEFHIKVYKNLPLLFTDLGLDEATLPGEFIAKYARYHHTYDSPGSRIPAGITRLKAPPRPKIIERAYL